MALDFIANPSIDEGARRRFEQAWREGVAPDLAAFLPAVDSPRFLPTLAELVQIDLEFRWAANDAAKPDGHECWTIENYLELYPALRQPAVLAELAAQERRVRSAAGESVSREDYLARFPELPADALSESSPASTSAGAARRDDTRVGAIHIPGYELLQVLGRGGIGVVYLAKQTRLQRMVAVKMLLAGAHAEATERERFQREAEAVARLQHPHIVQVYEVGEAEGRLYIVFEFVAGGHLGKKLDGSPLEAREAAELARTLAEAIEHAHRAGVIHRDLKPANVMLTPEGVAKIGDFGLAKQMSAPEGATQTGDVLGTPSYMAPEQAAGRIRDIGPSTDVYALGAILYELLTGRPPFRGTTTWETLSQVLTSEPVTPSHLQPLLPADLETICLKALDKEPARRYATAQALADDLTRFLNHEPIVARPAGWTERTWRWCWRNPALAGSLVVIALLLVAAAAGGVGFGLYQQNVVKEIAGEQAKTQTEQQRTLAEQKKTKAALDQSNRQAADLLFDRALQHCERGDVELGLLGMAQAYARSGEQDGDLRQALRANLAIWGERLGRLREIVRSENQIVASSQLSADGKCLAVVRRKPTNEIVLTLHKAQLGENIGQPLACPTGPPRLVFSPRNDRLFLFAPIGVVRTIDTTTGAFVGEEWKLPPPGGDLTVSANGEMVAALFPVTTEPGKFTTRIEVRSAVDGKPFAEPRTVPGYARVAFHPSDGSLLVVQGRGPNENGTPSDVRFFDMHRFHLPDWKSVQEVQSLGGPVFWLAYSADGQRMAVAFQTGQVQLFDGATGVAVAPPYPPEPIYPAPGQAGRSRLAAQTVAFSPNGRWLAVSQYEQVAVLDAQQGSAQSLWRAHDLEITSIAFSPSGNALVTAGLDGVTRLWEPETGRALGRPMRRVSGGTQPRAAFAGSETHIVAYGDGDALEFWDAESAIASAGVELPAAAPVGWVLFHPTLDRIAVIAPPLPAVPESAAPEAPASERPERFSELRWWNLSGEAIGESIRIPASVTAAILSDRGELAVGSDDGLVRRWSDEKLEPILPTLELGQSITALAYVGDGEVLYAGGAGGLIRRWDTATQQPLSSDLSLAPGVYAAVGQLQVHDSGARLLAAGYQRGVAEVWEQRENQWQRKTVPNGDWPFAAALQHDGDYLLASFRWPERGVAIWNSASLQKRGPEVRHAFPVLCAAFAPGGKVFATGSGVEGTAPQGETRLFETASGRPLGPPLRHATPVRTVRFDAAGKILYSHATPLNQEQGGDARLWDVATGKQLGPAYRLNGSTNCGALHSSGRVIAVGGEPNATLEIQWAVPPGQEANAAPILFRRLLEMRSQPAGPRSGAVQVWRLPAPLDVADEYLPAWVAALTRMRLDEHGVPATLTDAEWRAARDEVTSPSPMTMPTGKTP